MTRIELAGERELPAIRSLFRDYWDSLGFPPDFQGFDVELASLPGAYALPRGRLLLAFVDDRPAGCIALRPLNLADAEVKRLYVRAEFRGYHLGRKLVERLIEEARMIGYEHLYCDTMPSMQSAIRLYRELRFVEVGPYSEKPTPGAIYFRLAL